MDFEFNEDERLLVEPVLAKHPQDRAPPKSVMLKKELKG